MHQPPESSWSALEWANQLELLAYLGQAPLATVSPEPTCHWVITGVPSNDYNGVVGTHFRADVADAAIAQTLARFRAQNVPFQWHILPGDQPADLARRLVAQGCRRLEPGMCMATRVVLSAEIWPMPSGLSIQRVMSHRDLSEWMDFWTAVHASERTRREILYASLGLAGPHPLRHFLARLDGRAVGICQGFLGKEAVGLYSLAVSAAARRTGIGTALVRAALREAARAGYGVVVLGPTPDSRPLYERLGFQLFESPANSYHIWMD